MEQDFKQRDEARLRLAEEERLRLEQERLANGGVRYIARLRPYPTARADDKLELPPSALEELERQQALDKGELLTFAVSVPSGPGAARASLGQTHAGVAEFTAEEGSVGVPPRVALCLTKGAGLDSLTAVVAVEVRFARLPRSAKSRVKFQPRGEGFHAGGAATMRMDLEHVLQESLRGHTALTEGDWLPIRYDGMTFELVVRELDPAPQVALLNTDLTVELMPSEQTEAELRAQEEAESCAQAKVREAEERESARLERARVKAAALPLEAPQGAEAVQLLLRLPDGGRLMRRFARAQLLSDVLDWVESEPDTRVEPGAFRVVQKWPGHCRELGPEEASESLGSLKFGRQEALFLQRLGVDVVADDTAASDEIVAADVPSAATESSASAPTLLKASEWASAEQSAHRLLDQRLEGGETPTAAAGKEPELEDVKGQELVDVFERLVAFGMPPPQAAIASKRFAAQLRELGDMGFHDWLEAVSLLEKYNGRLLRVANLLSEQGTSETTRAPPARPALALAPAPALVPPMTAPAPVVSAPVKDNGAGLPKEQVAAKFRELVAAGAVPAEAAALAIKHVRAAVQAQTAASTTAQTPASVGSEADLEAKLQELASMGFADEARNRVLIRKYAGRMDRVVEVLCAEVGAQAGASRSRMCPWLCERATRSSFAPYGARQPREHR